ncbi:MULTISPECIES: MFS transporter [unclassified Microbacterium]|uniref:MFS transporter n=1 Tax=unclassified Microbacterium TaxID=2609290 RepID=UPI0012FCC501|nr:MFS transporter [Microbacterium sp. MAH-37]MVQ40838.1 MFS transporter [Microbacterium sp. MAH-37]
MTVIERSYRGPLRHLLLLGGAMFLVGTNAFVIAGLLPRISVALHTTQAAVSYTVTAYSLVVAVAAPAIAILLPRLPQRVLMAAGAGLFAVGTAITAIGSDLGWFAVGRILAALGGAALVPTATAVGAELATPDRRGRALAIVGAGFTLATALGAPLGTAAGSVFGWRMPLAVLALAGAAIVVPLLALFRMPGRGITPNLRTRFAPLADPRILLTLIAFALAVAAFNVVYIFSGQVTAAATGGSGTHLAALLLAFGAGGVAGNLAAGAITDRLGGSTAALIALAVQLLALGLIAPLEADYPALLLAFVVWGAASAAISIPVQHRLVSIAPSAAAVTMSWYSTALYLGIALAPPLGNAAAALGGALLIPLTGAAATIAAVVLLLAGHARRSREAGAEAVATRD